MPIAPFRHQRHGRVDAGGVGGEEIAKLVRAILESQHAGAESERGKAEVWKQVAHQAAGHLDCIMLYATSHPTDSHVTNANAFLVMLRAVLGIEGPHRTQSQIRLESHLPLPPFPAIAIETGAHDGCDS